MSIFNVFCKQKQAINVPDSFTVTAHTGAMHTPHNSIASAEACIDSGADIIEVDVTLRNDGTFVLIHKNGAADGEGVLITDFFELLKDNSVRVNLDLKSFHSLDTLEKLVKDRELTSRVFFTGVEEKNFDTVRCSAPTINAYLNFRANPSRLNDADYAKEIAEKLISLGAIGLNSNYKGLSPTIISAVHERGLSVSAWTVDRERDMRRLISWGVDNITTKEPPILMRVIGR